MSRRTFPGSAPNTEVVVGWDQPLQTFFCQVHDLSKDEDEQIIHWVGCCPRELYEVEDLDRALGKFAKLTPQMKSRLYGDKDDGL